MEKLKEESLQQLEFLREGGAIGVARPVKISATGAFAPDGEVPVALGDGEKRVHLIRHGQGFHNLLADIYKELGKKFNSATGEGGADNPYLRPEVLDPPLTEVGRSQARWLQPLAKSLRPELVVVSPMVRATQTALIAFEHLVAGAATEVPFVAHEGCHEIGGVHVCDRRRALGELRKDFPMVDYSAASVAEDDPLWSETERESPRALAARGYEFMLWLRGRQERDIVVAAHSAWLFALLNAVVDCEDDGARRWFATGEMRSFVFRFAGEAPPADEPAAKRSRTD